MFGKEFKVLKELPRIYKKVGDNYDEYFWAYEENGLLEYCIMDDNFCQPSLANFSNTEYAKKLRNRSDKILKKLVDEKYIEIIKGKNKMRDNKSRLSMDYKKRLGEFITEEDFETIEVLFDIDNWLNEESEKQEALEEKFKK